MLKNKKRILVNVVLLTGVVLFIGCKKGDRSEKDNSKQETIKIGATLPMTGPFSEYGESFNNGATLAVEEINDQGGINGKKLKWILHNNELDGKKSVSDFRSLVDTEGAKVVFTTAKVPVSAIQPLAEQEKVLLFAQQIASKGGEYYFNDFYDANEVGVKMAQAAGGLSTESMCIFATNIDEATELVDDFKKEYEENQGGEVKLVERFVITDIPDFRTALLKVKEADCQGVYAYLLPHMAGNLLKQMKELDLTGIDFYAAHFQDKSVMSNPENVKILDEMNLVLSNWFSVNIHENPEYLAFEKAHKERFGKEPGQGSGYTYDDVKVLAKVMKICDDKKEFATDCFRTELLKIRDYKGAAGDLSFETTDAERGIYIEQYKDGQWVPFDI